MSWAEVCKINKNIKRSLNEQLRDMKYNPIRVVTTSTSYTPEKTGLYKVICVGAGGDGTGYISSSTSRWGIGGGAGGVAIKNLYLDSSTSYAITVSTTASFSNELTATAGTDAGSASSNSAGTGGTASGGDYNFQGTSGGKTGSSGGVAKGGSVGVVITDLSRKYKFYSPEANADMEYGESILEYGAGAPGATYLLSTGASYGMVSREGSAAAVIIIPIEMEE